MAFIFHPNFTAVAIIMIFTILTLHSLSYNDLRFPLLVFLWLKATQNASEYLTPCNILVSTFEAPIVFNCPFDKEDIGYDHQAYPV